MQKRSFSKWFDKIIDSNFIITKFLYSLWPISLRKLNFKVWGKFLEKIASKCRSGWPRSQRIFVQDISQKIIKRKEEGIWWIQRNNKKADRTGKIH